MLYLGILATFLLLSSIGSAIWGIHWRNNFAGIRGAYDDLVDQVNAAEQEAEKVKQEMEWQRTTIGAMAARQSFVVLSDEQLSFLCSSISQIVAAAMKDPTRLN